MGWIVFSIVCFAISIIGYMWEEADFVRTEKQRKASSKNEKVDSPSLDPRNVISLFAKLVSVDNEIKAEEIELVNKIFEEEMGFHDDQLEIAMNIFNESLESNASLEYICSYLKEHLDYETRLWIIYTMYKIAYSDNQLAPEEDKIIRRAGLLIGISEYEISSARKSFEPPSYKSDELLQYYELLGITPSASESEIKSAYRKLIHKYHPDNFGHLDPVAKELAEEKVKKLNEAYEKLMAQK